jgi:hypothetical protein
MSQHHGKKQHHTWSLFIHLVPSLLTLFYCYKKHLCKPHLMLTNTRRATFEGVWILVSLWPIGVENWEKPRAMALQDLVDWKGRPVNPKRHGGVKATMFIYCKQPCLFCFFLFLWQCIVEFCYNVCNQCESFIYLDLMVKNRKLPIKRYFKWWSSIKLVWNMY